MRHCGVSEKGEDGCVSMHDDVLQATASGERQAGRRPSSTHELADHQPHVVGEGRHKPHHGALSNNVDL